MLPQQPKNTAFRSAKFFVAKAGPDLPIALSGENGFGQELANPFYEFLVRVYLGLRFFGCRGCSARWRAA
jgi:hypothetical protein